MENNNLPAPFIIDRDYEFFTPLDLIATVMGLLILYIMLYIRRRRHRDLDYYKYLLPAFSFKIFFVLVNALFYIIAYNKGGDSIGYWDGAVKLNHLFWKDPMAYFQELFQSNDLKNLYKNFDLSTGYPDGKIYEENESFFISKIASFFTFFTFKGYILMSFIFAYITTLASWRLYELVRSIKMNSDWHIALAIFFIPSLSFWCGGISKDTVVFVSICYLLHHIYQIISNERKSSWINWLIVFICIYIIVQVRSFVVITIIVPLIFAYSSRISNKYKDRGIERRLIKSFLILCGITVMVLFFQSPEADQFIKEASVINQDMTNNKTYGTKRYDMGITDFSLNGMVKAFPIATFYGIFRPYLWESFSFQLILNGIESIVLMFFTIRFFLSKHVFEKIRQIRRQEFLIFVFFFAIILAFFAGFTSILFGVLVRFKAPVLPFLVIILTANVIKKNHFNEIKSEIVN